LTTFLIPLLIVAVGTIVALAVNEWRRAQVISVTYSPPPSRVTRLWTDWDATEWWQYGVIWDDYEEE
jgi:hypothetical protein